MERSYQQMPSQYDDIRCEEEQPGDDRVQTSSAKEQSEDDRANEEVPLLIALEDGVYIATEPGVIYEMNDLFP